jgi:hypothetical protein
VEAPATDVAISLLAHDPSVAARLEQIEARKTELGQRFMDASAEERKALQEEIQALYQEQSRLQGEAGAVPVTSPAPEDDTGAACG